MKICCRPRVFPNGLTAEVGLQFIKVMKKKCKRKVYGLVNPITYAIAGACVTPKHELDRLRLRELTSLEAIAKGRGGIREWAELVDVHNLVETMAENGIGPEALESCAIAQESLINAKERFEKTGKMGLDGVGINAMRDVIEYANLQQQSISRSQFEEMIRKTLMKLRNNRCIEA